MLTMKGVGDDMVETGINAPLVPSPIICTREFASDVFRSRPVVGVLCRYEEPHSIINRLVLQAYRLKL